jgi:hypothetical protein
LLKDPESLPSIMHKLMRGRLGTAVLRAMLDKKIDPNGASDDEIEAAFYAPDALVLRLTPDAGEFEDLEVYHRKPRYEFTVTAD